MKFPTSSNYCNFPFEQKVSVNDPVITCEHDDSVLRSAEWSSFRIAKFCVLQGLGHLSWVKADLVIVYSVPRLARRRSWERLHFLIFKWNHLIRQRTLAMTQVRDCFRDFPFTASVCKAIVHASIFPGVARPHYPR